MNTQLLNLGGQMPEPIQKEQFANMNVIAKTLDDIFNGKDAKQGEKKRGFTLLVFPFGETPDGRINYISNSERESMLVAMKEFIAKNVGNFHENDNKTEQ